MTRNLSRFANDFPVPDGRAVVTGHVLYCDENGHAKWEVDGVDQGVCPRCNTVLPVENTRPVKPSNDVEYPDEYEIVIELVKGAHGTENRCEMRRYTTQTHALKLAMEEAEKYRLQGRKVASVIVNSSTAR